MNATDILNRALEELRNSTANYVQAKVLAKGISVPTQTVPANDKQFIFDLQGVFDEVTNAHVFSWEDISPGRPRKSILVENNMEGFRNEALFYYYCV